MATFRFVAMDLGAESGRVLLGLLQDDRLSLEEKHRFLNPTARLNGRWHWNLLAQWEHIKEGLKKAVAGLSEPVSGVGVDTWGVDFGLIGRGGELLGNPVTYRDNRTDGIMEKVFARVPRQKIFEATGIQFMQLNTLYQLYALRESGSPLLDVAEQLLFMPDLFHWLLSGKAVNEFAIASTSQMFDPVRKQWAMDLLASLDLPAHLLGQIVPSGTVLGTLRKELADELDIHPMPVITPASHDTGSAVVSVPATGDSWCYISSGTWSLMGVELPGPVINAKSLALNYTNEGGFGGTTRFLKNIMGLWLVQECRRAFVADGHDHSYGELTQMAERADPFRTLVDPDYPPLFKPGQMPSKIEQYAKQTQQPTPNTRGEFIRTCLDSLALTYRRTLDGLESTLGRRIDVVHVVGGGSQNELLNQLTADACGRTVIAGPVEATGIGNIMVQAMASGAVPDLQTARRIVRESFPVKRFEPESTPNTERAYQRFRELTDG